MCEEDEVVSTTSYEKEKAPVREGDVVGTINLYVNGIRIKSINCYANKSVAKATYETFFKRLFDRFFFHYNIIIILAYNRVSQGGCRCNSIVL